MTKLMLAIAIAWLPFSAMAADDELAGTHKLISSPRKIVDADEDLDTWGKKPRGYEYGRDGRMLVLIVLTQ